VCPSSRVFDTAPTLFPPDEATSDKAKAHAREILEAAGHAETNENTDTEEHKVRVLAGYKAALSSECPVLYC
jgi:hypothetical protein